MSQMCQFLDSGQGVNLNELLGFAENENFQEDLSIISGTFSLHKSALCAYAELYLLTSLAK